MPRVLVAAGSNVDAHVNLRKALAELRTSFPGLQSSHAYRNRAVGFTGDDFINLVVSFETELPLSAVVHELQRIEAVCGRERSAPRWAPRRVDLDILLYGDLVSAGGVAVLPRPDLLRRAYMLGPAAALAPQLCHPTESRTLEELWQAFDRGSHPLIEVPL